MTYIIINLNIKKIIIMIILDITTTTLLEIVIQIHIISITL
jgi:hypothetical protein